MNKNIWSKLAVSLQNNHPALNSSNPVLKKDLPPQRLSAVLAQYCFLVRWIVSFLSIGHSRLSHYPKIAAELQRNIGEELGSKTWGLSHQRILYRCLKQELGLTVTKAQQSRPTQQFLEAIQNGLIHETEAFAAGVVYGLEASAVPELKIVAQLINRIGSKPKINMAALDDPNAAARAAQMTEYTLEEFFVLHTFHFERGHESRLRITINKELPNDALTIQEFQQGFEYLLTLMDIWWEELAN